MVRFPAAFPVDREVGSCAPTANRPAFQAVLPVAEGEELVSVRLAAAVCSQAVADSAAAACFGVEPDYAGPAWTDGGRVRLCVATRPRCSTTTIKPGLQRFWPRARLVSLQIESSEVSDEGPPVISSIRSVFTYRSWFFSKASRSPTAVPAGAGGGVATILSVVRN